MTTKPRDHRATARVWASFIYVALRWGIKGNHRGADLDLAFVVNEANILRAMALIACDEAGRSFDEFYSEVSALVDTQTTKVARRYFDNKRKRWKAIEDDIIRNDDMQNISLDVQNIGLKQQRV